MPPVTAAAPAAEARLADAAAPGAAAAELAELRVCEKPCNALSGNCAWRINRGTPQAELLWLCFIVQGAMLVHSR